MTAKRAMTLLVLLLSSHSGLAITLRSDIATRPMKAAQNGCGSNRPFTHDAPIWSLLLSLPPDITGTDIDPTYGIREVSANVAGKQIVSGNPTPLKVTISGRDFTGTAAPLEGEFRVTFDQLTLAEAASILSLLADKPDALTAPIGANALTVTTYRIPIADKDDFAEFFFRTLGDTASMTPAQREARVSRFFEAVIDASTAANAPGVTDRNKAAADVLNKALTLPDQRAAELTANVRTATGIDVTRTAERSLAKLDASTITIDANSTAQTMKNLTQLVNESRVPRPTGQGPKAAASSGDAPPPIMIVDEPCFNFSLAPIVSGDSQLSNAVTLRGRYDFYSAGGTGFLKFRGEGNSADSGSYFKRAEATVDLGFNRRFPAALVALSATGHYSLADKAKASDPNNDQWAAVAKAQVSLPSLGLLPGAATRPLLAIEAGAIGGHATPETAFTGQGHLRYTQRTSVRLSIDIVADAAFSPERSFGGRKNFAYVNAQFRYNLNRDWDYVARYECGRKAPTYDRFCGWLSGIALVTGR